MEIILARSKAGHDKGRLYAVIGKEANLLLLADGKYRGMNNPKKKKEKHLQSVKRFPEEVREYINEIKELTDSDIKKIIKLYMVGIEES